ncbi:MAG TPA: right-handed parallel beta-helix repeat-containing protein [Planctomycetota bacterium]|nr:right-handed parallel beta-helix repeat-containing protein [Planctomycetota bacterium]
MDMQRGAKGILSMGWVAVLGLLVTPAAAQTTWHVPGDVPTIQEALALASDGDLIEVQPGTYPEALDTLGKTITLRGLAGAELTVVDAIGQGAEVLAIAGGSPLIEGFTLTGGEGGVRAETGTPTLRDCIIRDNSLTTGSGGGVHGESGSLVTLQDCTLRGNTTSSYGGGAAKEVLLTDCLVEDNQAAIGGGLSSVLGATGCVIRGNWATVNGGGVAGALDKISNCVIQGNTASDKGGGMFSSEIVPASGMLPPVADVALLQNQAITGGGLYYELAQPAVLVGAALTRVVIADNLADSANDGAYIDVGGFFGSGDVSVESCTFGSDRLYVLAGALKVSNSIVWGLTGALQWVGFGTGLQVSYSDVKGGAAGPGNMNADPLFADALAGDYSLGPGSPCINKGDPSAPHDPDGTVVDMGALTYDPWTDLGSALAGTHGEPVLAGTGSLNSFTPGSFVLTGALENVAATLVIGLSQLDAPFKGGVMVPSLDVLLPGLPTDAQGALTLPFLWPAGLPSGVSIVLQFWLPDPAGPKGFAASNGLQGTTP